MRKNKGKAKEVVDEGYGEENAATEKDRGGPKDSDVKKSTQTGAVMKQQDRGNSNKTSYNLRSRSKAATGQEEAASTTTDAAQATIGGNKEDKLEPKRKEKDPSPNKRRNAKEEKLEDPPYWGKVGWYRGYCVRDLQERAFRMRNCS